MPPETDRLLTDIEAIPSHQIFGRVTAVQGLLVEVAGIERHLSVGSRCHVIARGSRKVLCEVVGFRDGKALLLPFSTLDGVGLGCKTEIAESQPTIAPSPAWLGRVVNALGEPIDGKGALPQGNVNHPIRSPPPPAHERQRVRGKLDLGVRGINTFLTCCRGQRMGIFSGSGVGKSILMSMVARYTSADISVIGLVGERGREVQEFLHDDLGPEGLARSVVVVATSDEAPLMRRQAAYMTLAIAEYFRDLGRDVLCLMDSITRFATAQREIGLSAGEPPTTKGFPPTTFAELPKLLERAGPGTAGTGTITGLFTVLVDGDDHNEPIADAVRGILDGHIVLDRAIAERGRYPAVNVLRSVSRTLPACNSDKENEIVNRARRMLAAYENMAEMIRLGAYRKGANKEVDDAIGLYGPLEEFMRQDRNERADLAGGYAGLAKIFGLMKSLITLIKLQKTRVDEQRLILVRMQEKLDLIDRAIAGLESEKIREAVAAKQNPESAVTYGAFLKQAILRGRALARERAIAEAAVNAAHDALTELFEEQKRYEIAEAARIEAEEREERRRETAELDEIGGVTHERRKAE